MKMKKLLASALAAAMVLSTMVGTVVTSAATTVGTITAGTVNAVAGKTDTITADINIEFTEDVVAPHNIISVALDGYTLSNVALGTVTYAEGSAEGVVTIDADGSNLAAGKILLEAPVDSKAPTVKAIALTATFVDADDVDTAVGTYTIVVNGDDMTDVNEASISIDAKNGTLTVAEAAHVHTPATAVKENVTDATCTTDGSYEDVVYCSECGEELSRTPGTIPATGAHDYVDGTCGTCGAEDPNYVAPCDHIDANQDGICDNECGYENLDATLTYYEKAMNLGADICGVYQVRNYKKDNKFANTYVSFKIIAEKTGDKYELELINTSDRKNYTTYYYKVTVLAREMADNIDTRIVGITAEGEAFTSNVDTWSIKQGLISKMDSASEGELTDDKLKTLKLAANMLNYGAEAQKNFSYNLDNLATDDLPEEYAKYIITETPEMSEIPKVDDTGAAATLKSIDFNLGERIMVLPSFKVPKDDAQEIYSTEVTQVHTAPDGTVTTKNYTIEGKDCIKSGKTLYVKFNNFASQDLRDVLTITLYKNGVAVSETHTFSAESALVAKRATNESLVAAIMNYGDCARAFFK